MTWLDHSLAVCVLGAQSLISCVGDGGRSHLPSLVLSFILNGEREETCTPPDVCEGQVREYSGRHIVGMVNLNKALSEPPPALHSCSDTVPSVHFKGLSRPPSAESSLCQDSSQPEGGQEKSHSCFKKKS